MEGAEWDQYVARFSFLREDIGDTGIQDQSQTGRGTGSMGVPGLTQRDRKHGGGSQD